MSLNYHRTIPAMFEQTCAEFTDKPAFSCMGQTLSFKDLDVLSAKFAAYLQQHTTLKPGDRLAVQLPNILQYPIVVFGALRAGLVVVNTNPLYTPHEVKHQLNDSGAKALVVLANIAKNAASIIHETAVEYTIVTEIADVHPPLKRMLINAVVKYVKKLVPSYHFPRTIAFRDTLKSAASSWQPVVADPEDIAILQYTGGTTGVSKGAMLTHRNLIANMEQLNEHMKCIFRKGQEFYIAPLPLYHIYSFTLHCTSGFALGNHSLLIPNPRDIPAFVAAIRNKPFTFFIGLNTLFNALLRNAEFRSLDFSHMRLTASGGMALLAETAKQWIALTGCPVSEGYGSTETSPVVSTNAPNDMQMGTVGKALPETECKVIDEAGNTLAAGETGELCVRGPQVMKGYWQRPEATAEVLDADGWFKTGDIAVISAEGFIKIVDRKKDMINVSGLKVYPNEVEDVLASHPDIVEAAVIGIPDAEGSEIVKAFLVTTNENLDAKTLRDFARTKLTGYKVPQQFEFCKELPKTNVGKVLRRELRANEIAKRNA